jgi:hypothetical protein
MVPTGHNQEILGRKGWKLPEEREFPEVLKEHLDTGTRAAGRGAPWQQLEFCQAVATLAGQRGDGRSDRT